jgi:predicted metallo-beta-lactamase superfamily hydrolase
MQIEILGAESLGVRGLCCFVKTKQRNILIDPGIALGYMRDRLLPHPVQIAMDEKIQKKIICAWKNASDVVISHFHGDHVPLENANPYQLDIRKLSGLNQNMKIWTKNPCHFSPTEEKRAKRLYSFLQADTIPAEGKNSGPMAFSGAVPHGRADNNLETVMMTRIEEDKVFVHASDIQLLDDETVSNVLAWKPDILLVGGPALYLSRLSDDLIARAWNNAARLSQATNMLILDHHLMRSHEGLEWLTGIASRTGNSVMCAADFMRKPRMLLEANRRDIYDKLPVPLAWHEDYARGKVTTDDFWFAAQSLSIITPS